MRGYKDENGCRVYEPDCADEWLELIADVAVDYDGCNTINGFKSLVDELVEMSVNARQCMKAGKLFPG